MINNNLKITVALAIFAVLTFCQLKGQEKVRNRREPPSIDQLFKDLDANEDGKLSQKEVKGPLKRDFAKVDANEDGFLAREELEKARKPERKGPPHRN